MHNFKAPQKATSTRVSATIDDTRLPGRPNHKFVYAHHPGSWDYDPVDGFLPRLTKIPLRAGINGCLPGPRGHFPVLARLRGEGWTVIDESGPVKRSDPNGEITDDTGYLMQWDGRNGPIFQDCWALPSVVGTGPGAVVDWASQYDRDGFRAFRKMLRDTGAVPAAQPAVLSSIVKVQKRRANRRIPEGHDGNPHVQKIMKREMARLQSMETDAAALGVKVKGRPRKKRGPGRPKKVAANGQ